MENWEEQKKSLEGEIARTEKEIAGVARELSDKEDRKRGPAEAHRSGAAGAGHAQGQLPGPDRRTR